MKQWNPIGSVLTVIMVVLFAFILIDGAGQPIQARLFPMTVGIVGLTLSIIQLLKEIVVLVKRGRAHAVEGYTEEPEADSSDPSGASDFAITAEEKTKIGRLRAAEQFLWLGGLLLALWLIGFHVAVPLMVGLYLLRHRESWIIIGGVSAGVAVVVWAVFDNLLNLPFPTGILVRMLGL